MTTHLRSIFEVSPLLREGKISPRELVEECLSRIDKYDASIRAWALVDAENARRVADEAGEQIAEGRWLGPMHGVPVGIKDIIDVAGLPTKAGSPTRENHQADRDAPLVAALRRAGANVLGKTVTVEFACFDPSPTRNPWDRELRHTPGGSSSGSAAALAMGMCYGSVGTQTGGSLVRPSSYCGTATLKPTFGRLPRDGIVPVSYSLDHPGPMARSVGDLRILYECLLQTVKKEERFGGTDVSPVSHNNSSFRLGLVEQLYPCGANEAVREVFDKALEKLKASGTEISPVSLPGGFDDVLPMHRRIMSVEAAEYHRTSFAENRSLYGPMISALLDEGLKVSAVDYAAALAWQRDYARRVSGMFDGVDALVMPSTDTPAPATLTTTGTPKYQAPWSCAGVPAASIPCGLSADGLPIGLQLIGPHESDWQLLDIAAWCEEILAFNEHPAILE
jgi:aspartyl-tRNA(Asn)/glutamyl-tRNA(Gln) amidotransferase subunit A